MYIQKFKSCERNTQTKANDQIEILGFKFRELLLFTYSDFMALLCEKKLVSGDFKKIACPKKRKNCYEENSPSGYQMVHPVHEMNKKHIGSYGPKPKTDTSTLFYNNELHTINKRNTGNLSYYTPM